jgi:argininosuccinate synthase
VTSTKAKPYSMDDNIDIAILFEQGLPVKLRVGDKEYTDSLELFIALNEIGKQAGIGRIDIVEVRHK